MVALNRAIAIGHAEGPQAGLAALDRLATEPALAGYHYLPAARAEFLHRLHRDTEAAAAYHEALHLTDNAVEREFLTTKLAQLQPARPTSTNRPSQSCRGAEDDRGAESGRGAEGDRA